MLIARIIWELEECNDFVGNVAIIVEKYVAIIIVECYNGFVSMIDDNCIMHLKPATIYYL